VWPGSHVPEILQITWRKYAVSRMLLVQKWILWFMYDATFVRVTQQCSARADCEDVSESHPSPVERVAVWEWYLVTINYLWKRRRGQGRVTPQVFGIIMLIAPKWLKLQTSDLTSVFPGTVWTWSLKSFLENAVWPGSHVPEILQITWRKYAVSR